jgi:hypothetical protein
MGIIGSQIYNAKFGPTCKVSYIVCIGILSPCVAATSATWYVVHHKNRREHNGNPAKENVSRKGSDVGDVDTNDI